MLLREINKMTDIYGTCCDTYAGVTTAQLLSQSFSTQGAGLLSFILEPTNAIPTTVYAKLAGEVNVVVDYGADPTFTTDSTVALTKAINYGISANKRVVIPGGTYKVSSLMSFTVPANTKFFLDCEGVVVYTGTVEPMTETGVFTFIGDATLVGDFSSGTDDIVGSSQIELNGLSVKPLIPATTLGLTDGILVKGFIKAVLNDCEAPNFSYCGIYLGTLKHWAYTNPVVTGCVYAGTRTGNLYSGFVLGGDGSNAGNSTYGVTYGYGIAFSVGDSNVNPNQDFLVLGYKCYNCHRKGLDVHCGVRGAFSYCNIAKYGYSACYAVQTTTIGEIVHDIRFTQNTISGVGNTVANSAGVEMGTAGDDTGGISGYYIFDDNTLVSTGATTGAQAVRVTGASTGTAIDRVSVTKNRIAAGAAAGVPVIRLYTSGVTTLRIATDGNTIHSVSCSRFISIESNDPLGSTSCKGNGCTADSGTLDYGIWVAEEGNCMTVDNEFGGAAPITSLLWNGATSPGYIQKNNIQATASLLVSFKDNYGSGRCIDFGTTTPVLADGYYRAGSKRFNSAPASGSPAEWICTTSGIAGGTQVYKPYANLP